MKLTRKKQYAGNQTDEFTNDNAFIDTKK